VLFAVLSAMALMAAPAFALTNPERTYEMVTPPYKGGYGVKSIEAVSPDGESVAFYSSGTFAGAPGGSFPGIAYLAQRGATGWVTTPVMPPAELLPDVIANDVSSTLGSVLYLGKPGASEEGAFQAGTESEVLLHSTGVPDSAVSWELGGMVLQAVPQVPAGARYEAASADLCHILLAATSLDSQEERYFLPEERGATGRQLYELNRGCDGEPVSLQRVGSNNKEKSMSPSCAIYPGAGQYALGHSAFHDIDEDGGEVFFTTCPGGMENGQHQLFVRLGGSKTLEVSKPLGEDCVEVPCAGAGARAHADFVGASEDGSVVYFTTAAPLEPATDKDLGSDLYMARIGCPAGGSECEVGEKVVTSLVQVSHDPNGGEGRLQGVVRLAPDGSRAYFVAQGDLLTGAQRAALEGEGRAVPLDGADNLYVYDSVTGQLAFIADLCTGHELSGAAEDLRCPAATGSDASLWEANSVGEAQTAGVDGKFLVFSTYAQLTSGDTDTVEDVYRYDAETGAIDRVSLGEAGTDANGNGNEFNATIATTGGSDTFVATEYGMNSRAISEDGSRIVFTSSEPLSSAAKNHLENAYEWHESPGQGEGRVSLISSGSAEEAVEHVVISPEGNDVFFLTSQGLVPQDTDGAQDIYDARLAHVPGEVVGLPLESAAQPQECSGDACQGALTNPAPLLVPGSVSQAPGGNFPVPVPVVAKARSKSKTVKCKRGYVKKKSKCVKKSKAKKAASHRRAK
jgi:hypothetical protein